MYPLHDLLIRPVKRTMTYTLLLREMLKYSKQANLKDQLDDIQQAIDVMERLTKNIDEMIAIDRLQDFDVGVPSCPRYKPRRVRPYLPRGRHNRDLNDRRNN